MAFNEQFFKSMSLEIRLIITNLRLPCTNTVSSHRTLEIVGAYVPMNQDRIFGKKIRIKGHNKSSLIKCEDYIEINLLEEEEI